MPSTEPKPSPIRQNERRRRKAGYYLAPTLKKSVGKYPYEIKLLENEEMKGRLKKLLGP